MNQPFLATIGPGHVVDQLVLIHLPKAIAGHGLLPAKHAAAVGGGELRLVADLLG
jgi:hypothetical protein